MSKLWLLTVLFAVIISSSFGTAFAASSDYFLKIDGIDGESSADKHKGEIDIQSFSWGMSNPSSMTSGGASSGKVQFQDFHFTKTIDKSSPKLMEAVATGEHLKTVDLSVRKAGGTNEYYVIHLTDVLVSSYSTSGGSGGVPMEEVSFTYQKIQMEYFLQNPDGTSSESYKTKELTGHVTLIK